MPLPKSVCLEHLMWNCRVCIQKNQQQVKVATTSVENAPTQASSTSVAEAAASSKNISPGAATKEDLPTPPVAASTSTAENSFSVTAASSSSGNEEVQQGQKRKESTATTPAFPSSSQSNKLLKVSKRFIECEVALKVLRGINLLDTRFINSGKVLAWALDSNHPDFLRIHDYFAFTQHPQKKPMKILSILRVITAAHKKEDNVPLDFSDYPDAPGMYRMMLWHGTPTGNVSSILENGFRVPSSDTGIHFADLVESCKAYCRKGVFSSVGYLFLCDVLLGYKRGRKESIMHRYSQFPRFQQLDRRYDKEIDGCIWPLAGGAERADLFFRRPYAYNNNFVVYYPTQVQPKYLIKAEF